MSQQFVWQKEDIPIALMLEVQYKDVPVSGLSPTVQVYKFTDDTYADFGTNTFVASGGTINGSLSGVPNYNGVYRRSFDPQNFGESGNQIYYMRYQATVPSGTGGLTSDLSVEATEVHYFTALSGIKSLQGMAVSFVS